MSASLITTNVEKGSDKTDHVRIRIDIYSASAFINFISILHRSSRSIISRIKFQRHVRNKILSRIQSPVAFTKRIFIQLY